MFSGLYGDLPKTKQEQDKDGASKAIKGTSSELDNAIEGHGNKKDVWTADATQKGTIAMAPPVLKRGPVRSKAVSYQGKAKSNSVAVARKSDTNGAKAGAGPSGITDKSTATDYSEEGVVDPYDPAKPNDYIEIRQQRENARRAAEEEAEKMERMKELEALEKLEAQQQGIDAASSKRRMELSVDGEQAYKRRAGIPLERTDDVESSKPLKSVKGMTLAQKMMEKMGWKAGEGLGKNKQGISSALTVEKTDVRSGRVGMWYFVLCITVDLSYE
jgi:splicing factor 45